MTKTSPHTAIPPPKHCLKHQCNVCAAGFLRRVELSAHLVRAHNHLEQYECVACDKLFTSVRSVARHNRIHHQPDTVHYCDQCDFSTCDKSNLELHRSLHTEQLIYYCNDCGKGYMERAKYLEHVNAKPQLGPNQCRPFKCLICASTFSYKRNLVKHMKALHPETLGDYSGPLYECHYCSQYFNKELTYKKHLNKSHAELMEPKKYQCESCDASYTIAQNLKRHVKIVHRGVKDVECEICGKSFGKNVNLKVHMRVHTGEKPYKCLVCGKAFSQKCTLTFHSRIHTGDRPYACELCGNRFVSTNLLNQHVRRHKKVLGELNIKLEG